MEDYLQHHGVKGMKWGVRKDRGSESERKQKKAEYKEYKQLQSNRKELQNNPQGKISYDSKGRKGITLSRDYVKSWNNVNKAISNIEKKNPDFRKRYRRSENARVGLELLVTGAFYGTLATSVYKSTIGRDY